MRTFTSRRHGPALAICLATVLLVQLLALITSAPPAHAALGAADFLKADGKYLRNNSGSGDMVTLRGTNLGGWLTQEAWMSPLGEFALDRTGWTATASTNSASATKALDGDATTGWSTGTAQAAGQWYQIDMGTPTLLNRVYLDAAAFNGDQAAGYQVLVSDDASTWSNVASGSAGGQRTAVTFPAQIGRYVRIVQTGTSSQPWTLAEFNAFSDPVLHNGGRTATTSTTGSGSAPGDALDGNPGTRWTTGTSQQPGQWFTVNLGAGTSVSKVLLDAGPTSAGDRPTSYEVWGSTDNTNWSKYASGTGSGRITTASFYATQYVQYLKIVQTGTSSNWWSIAGLALYSGDTFDRSGWSATATATESGGSPSKAIDANTSSRWSTGQSQSAGQFLQIDLGATETFNQVQLDNTADPGDYPRGYSVQVSTDGTHWNQVASGSGYPKATPISFPAASGRYIKLALTASSSAWWSVDEASVSLYNDDNNMNVEYQSRFGATTTQSILNTHMNSWIQASDLDNIAAMGMNTIRLPIGWRTLLNDDGTWKTNAFTKIDWLVSQAAQRNIYVILDLHSLPGGNCPWGSCGRQAINPNEFWSNATYQDWVNDIWHTMAARYAGNPTVAGYDLMNEPLLSYNESTSDVTQKSAYYDRLYKTVRAVDPDHVIFMQAFFSWENIAAPSTYGWTNVAYELHPYNMPEGQDHDAQSDLVQTQLAAVTAKQADPAWQVPVLYGEYQLYQHDDVWQQWMAGLNALHVSWTNWNYKVTAGQNEPTGGYWGFYNSNSNPVPVINSDDAATITAKLGKFTIADFQPNTAFIDDVKPLTGGRPWMQPVVLPQTGWSATASSTESGGSPAAALDWNTSTRWSTGASQSDGQWFQVDMGSLQAVDQVSFETRSNERWDYSRAYRVQVSADASTWTTVRSGDGIGWKQVLAFAPQYARYVRITQTGSAQEWWSIAEFHAYAEPALGRASWTATASSSASGTTPSAALDGDSGTRWSTGAAQSNSQWYQVDFGRAQTFDQVVLDAGSASSGDYPRGYEIQVSDDGSTWTTAATGTGTGWVTLADFPAQTARYLKIVQTGTSSTWWSVNELFVYGEQENSATGWSATASSTGAGSSTANAFDGDLTTRWTSGTPQASGQWFQLDQGSPQWFNQIVMDVGTSTGDSAASFVVQTSNDASTWKTVANGEAKGDLVTANFPIVQARYARVTLQAASAKWWSIAEFRVFQ
ncbi:discoidin domain-containing protein [Streptomyces sp. NBC_00080]|uniref:discoidin domain-containing protein n=1 Tax=Streptomyces sp. NBC_00080 TaxID=2975645 RepID=UPI003254B900